MNLIKASLTVILTIVFLPSLFSVIPDKDSKWTQSLNGTWDFKYLEERTTETEHFFEPEFDISSWTKITVPGNWEMQGFEEPHYFFAGKSLGLYRTSFTLPENWDSRQVFLCFEGVSFGYECWVNGKKAGRFESAFQRSYLNITSLVKAGEENHLAVLVYKDHEANRFDSNDAWALSGIFRDVYLFSLPVQYIDNLDVRTTIGNHQSALLDAKIEVRCYRERKIEVFEELSLAYNLKDREDKSVSAGGLPVRWANPEFLPTPASLKILVNNARYWNAEDPYLYELELYLLRDKDTIQRITQPVGFREVNIDSGVLKINGQPVKLRGVCRHEIHPEVGRALRERHWREDLELMKKANINAIRTSHYPPHPRFLELCDEMGFYVDCEVPFGFGDELLTSPYHLGSLLGRANFEISRDRNHPSIIIWSIGNENPVVDAVIKTGQYVKFLDPTRPILFPGNNFWWGAKAVSGLPDFLDIHAKHYPSAEDIEQYALDSTISQTFLFTEYNHSLDVAFGGLKDKWEIIEKYDNLAGGMIWLWADQGIYRNIHGKKVIDSYENIHLLEGKDTGLSADRWLNKDTVMDSHGQFGTDGIVYADRLPQTDYYETRKVYSPAIILEDTVHIKSGQNLVRLSLENRYDFTNLDQVKINWEYRKNNKQVEEGMLKSSLAPHQKGELKIDIKLKDKDLEDVNILHIYFTDPYGIQVYEKSVVLNPGDQQIAIIPEFNQNNGNLEDDEVDDYQLLQGNMLFLSSEERYQLTFDDDGLFNLTDRKTGEEYITKGPMLKVGRKATMAEQRMYERKEHGYWKPYLLDKPSSYEIKIKEEESITSVLINYLYERDDDPNQKINLVVKIGIKPEALLDIQYEIEPIECKGYFTELGISFFIPEKYEQFGWLGDGPYPSYPKKEMLNETGFYSKSIESPYFEGNHKDVQLAFIPGKAERGLGFSGEHMNIGLDCMEDKILVSHNLLVSSPGTKFKFPLVSFPAGEVGKKEGALRIMILDKKNKDTKYKVIEHFFK